MWTTPFWGLLFDAVVVTRRGSWNQNQIFVQLCGTGGLGLKGPEAWGIWNCVEGWMSFVRRRHVLSYREINRKA
jgi:hypothetical protein